ncbi:hypothetical protein [Agarilytica rhodophyticola]|uniref:hypothetical protein n=1 Tax=Agarilytica rhodophyticola TaxID=1737490 RepID=UPI00131541CF|nr:hypothetical protein [Agarilytica rhodophyticola]
MKRNKEIIVASIGLRHLSSEIFKKNNIAAAVSVVFFSKNEDLALVFEVIFYSQI